MNEVGRRADGQAAGEASLATMLYLYKTHYGISFWSMISIESLSINIKPTRKAITSQHYKKFIYFDSKVS
jgi:hypothetical protein